MESVPVDADDVGRRLARKGRSDQSSDGVELFGWAPSEDVDVPTAPVGGRRTREPTGRYPLE
jgi:hypothetical protein